MTLFALARSVTNRRADGGRFALRALMAYCLWLKGLEFSHWPLAISAAFGGYRPTSARHSVSSVFSVDYKKFVSIRVHSWFQINGLAVFLNSLPRQSHPFLRAVLIAFQRLHILQRNIETRSFQRLNSLLKIMPRNIFPIVADQMRRPRTKTQNILSIGNLRAFLDIRKRADGNPP